MKANLRNLLLISILISFFACEKEKPIINPNQETDYETLRDSVINSWNSIMINSAKDITLNLQGKFLIDTLAIAFQNKQANTQAGIYSDTVLLELGEINFGKWKESDNLGYPDNTSYSNEGEMFYGGQSFSIKFNYLSHLPEEGIVFSFLDWNITDGATTNWNSEEGNYLCNLGILDGIEIVKINENEYYFVGLNKGMKKMKIRRK